MFDLTPLSRPVAVVEMLLLLLLAAFVGWVLARLILNNRIYALRSAIADQESELDECRRSKVAVSVVKTEPISPIDIKTTLPSPLVTARVSPIAVVTVPGSSSAGELPSPERAAVEPVKPVPNPIPVAAIGSETAVLQRIAARAGELNFARIGLASAAEADDLKDIVGIGPFLERKLHSLGIYTFRQVSHFEKEDIDKVNDIIEFFPGRIERDNWVDQSKVFYERKYGKSVSDKTQAD